MAAAKRFYVSGVGGPYEVRDRWPYKGAVNDAVASLEKYKDAREYAKRLNDLYEETARAELPTWDFVKRLPTNEEYMTAAREKLLFTYDVDCDDVNDGDVDKISSSADGAWVPVWIWVPVGDAMADEKDAAEDGGEKDLGWKPGTLPEPSCVASMGCLCAGHARGTPVDARCDTSEVK